MEGILVGFAAVGNKIILYTYLQINLINTPDKLLKMKSPKKQKFLRASREANEAKRSEAPFAPLLSHCCRYEPTLSNCCKSACTSATGVPANAGLQCILKKPEMKGIALIAGVIFLAITITAVVIIYQTGVPFIKKIQSSVTIDQIETAFTQLNKIIQTVASEGRGSQRTITLKVESGEVTVNGSKDFISWDYETDAFVISPRTVQELDNLKIGSNLETSAYESTLNGEDVFVLENKHIQVYIKKIGSENNSVQYNTSQLLKGIHQKNSNQDLDLDTLDILFDNGNNTGIGYTKLDEKGDNLPFGVVTAFMDPDTSDIVYHIDFILESGADFLTIRGRLS